MQAAYFGKRVPSSRKRPIRAAPRCTPARSRARRCARPRSTSPGYRARDLYGVAVELDDRTPTVPRFIARKDADRGGTSRAHPRRTSSATASSCCAGRRRASSTRTRSRVDARRRARAPRSGRVLPDRDRLAARTVRADIPTSPSPTSTTRDEILALDALPDHAGGARRRRDRLRVRVHVRGARRRRSTLVEARTQILPVPRLSRSGERLETRDGAPRHRRIRTGRRWRPRRPRAPRGRLVCDLADGSRARLRAAALRRRPRRATPRASALERVGLRAGRARLPRGRRALPDRGAAHLRGRRRDRLPRARVDLDGAGARRRLPRLRLRLQAVGRRDASLRHLHDPRGELRRRDRGELPEEGHRLRASAARSTATTRAARSSATSRA